MCVISGKLQGSSAQLFLSYSRPSFGVNQRKQLKPLSCIKNIDPKKACRQQAGRSLSALARAENGDEMRQQISVESVESSGGLPTQGDAVVRGGLDNDFRGGLQLLEPNDPRKAPVDIDYLAVSLFNLFIPDL